MELELSPLGARITSINYLNQNQWVQVHEYYPTTLPYTNKRKYTGATVGPIAGRIRNGIHHYQNVQHPLTINEGDHTLHSGEKGLHAVVWDYSKPSENQVVFSCLRETKDDGFPGKRIFEVKYTLTKTQIDIEYLVSTTEACHINLTNHAYFNLNGTQNLEHHTFAIDAQELVELDPEKLPTGKLLKVKNTWMDLNRLQRLDGRVFDHCFVISHKTKPAATAIGEISKIRLDVFTDQPAIQFYSGNQKFFCFESQHYPDSLNHPQFPSTLLKPDEHYAYHCSFRFSSPA